MIDNRLFCRRRALPLAIFLVALGACSTSPQGRTHIVAPAPVSDVYSDANLRIQLATTPSVQAPCLGVECQRTQNFGQQVQQLGDRLASSAFDLYPDLQKRVRQFEFVIAEKEEPGSTSNAAGKIVIFRGAQKLDLDESALAFLIAREMGHVIAQHHDENSAARILLSVAAGVIFPALNLFANSATVAQATSVTSTSTLATTAASTATSFIGSNVVLESIKPNQLTEADSIALNLLEQQGWSRHDIASAFEAGVHPNGGNAWTKDFRTSVDQLIALAKQSEIADLKLSSESIDLQPIPDNAQIADAPAGESGGSETTANSEAGRTAEGAIKLAGLADEMKSMISGTATDAAPEHGRIETTHRDGGKDNVSTDPAGENTRQDIAPSPVVTATAPDPGIIHTAATGEEIKQIAEKRNIRMPGKVQATKARKLNSVNQNKAARVPPASVKSSRKPGVSASTNKKPAKISRGKKADIAKNHKALKGPTPGKSSAQKNQVTPKRTNQSPTSASNNRPF